MAYAGEICAIAAAFFWAIGVILFKKSGESMEPMGLNFFKNGIAALLYVPTIILTGGSPIPADQPLESWLLLAASGLLGITVGDTMFFISLEKLGAGLTAVVDTSYTPIMLALSFFMLGEQLGPEILIGAGMIVTGLLVGSATRPPPGKTQRDIIWGSIIGIVSVFFMGLGVVMIKGVLNQAPVIWATAVRVFFAGLGLIPFILLSPRRRMILASLKPSRSWKVALPGALCGTYLTMMAWVGGMKFTAVSRASLLNQLSTIFIFILATVVLRESLTLRKLSAIALACTGAVLVIWQ